MRVIVGCEFSGIVRDAFRHRGHDAWSCDILPCERSSQWHIQGDVLKVLDDGWDLGIFHPPCTHLSVVANRAYYGPNHEWRKRERERASDFFMALYSARIPRVAVENPTGVMNTAFRKPDQIIHPYYFGEPVQKRTCLWLRFLPKLTPTEMLPKPEPLYICQGLLSYGKAINNVEGIRGHYGERRSHARSRSFEGIADAMADQWGILDPL